MPSLSLSREARWAFRISPASCGGQTMATAKKKSSARKTAPEVEPEVAARNRANAARRAAGKPDTTRNHDANPDNPTDSSVRHAEPQTGHRTREGHGGYPSGEYDVTKPQGDG